MMYLPQLLILAAYFLLLVGLVYVVRWLWRHLP